VAGAARHLVHYEPTGLRATSNGSVMELFVRGVKLISQLFGYLAAALIALSVLVVCHMVFVRYVLNQNTIWQTDFVTYSLVAATFLGSPFVLTTRGHVAVDILPLYSGPRLRWWLALFAATVTFFFCMAMTALSFQFWHESWDNSWVSDTMWRARLWIPYAALPVGLGLLSLQCFADLISLVSGREPPFGIVKEHR
jgi:TRAP-type C4-dicarboxylate transport system permease small subunit